MNPGLSPSRTRHGVILFAVLLGIIHYIDRVCISKARPFIQEDLKLDDTQMGYVFSAFTLAYAMFEIPGGWLGDKWGPRRVLLRIVMFWSFFTAATGYAWNQTSMVVCRFLFGAGEAGGFPNIAKMFSVWLPQREHDMAQGITWLAARWGGAFTPLLVVWVLGMVSWRMTFVIFAFLGVIWAVFFARWFRDNPKDHPRVNAAELALLADAQKNLGSGHAKIPWRRLLATRSVLLLWLYYFCISYVWYFYITWLPKFMEAENGLHMDMAATSTSILNGMPLFLGGIGCFVGGLAARRLAARSRHISAARRVVGVTGMLAAGALIMVAAQTRNATFAMLALGVSGFFNDLSMPGAWGACMDIGGKLAGSVSGSMNMIGNFGGALGGVAVPWLMKSAGLGWDGVLYVAASTYLISALCWLFIDSDERLHA
ncbi:MAG: MFS transporter [Verrucomicrobiaceae bacterium]|jgi:ACS family glucarate transporter-like MFS transporter|nr:MFS transporter [Verrucomicrobiaceae bacterium]